MKLIQIAVLPKSDYLSAYHIGLDESGDVWVRALFGSDNAWSNTGAPPFPAPTPRVVHTPPPDAGA